MNKNTTYLKNILMVLAGAILGLSIVGWPDIVPAKDLDEQFMMLMAARNAAKAEKYNTAITRYRKVLKMPGSHLDVQAELGWVFIKAGKYREGQREFETVLKKDPDNITALRGQLEGVRKAKDSKTEYKILTRLVQLSPKDRELRKQLALALHNQGKFKEAEKHLSILMGEN